MIRPATVGDVMDKRESGLRILTRCRETTAMSLFEWVLGLALVVVYLACMFWVGARTFQRGHLVLGILGVLLPPIWFVGAFLPDRKGSRTEPAISKRQP
jgi:hypothetical protein